MLNGGGILLDLITGTFSALQTAINGHLEIFFLIVSCSSNLFFSRMSCTIIDCYHKGTFNSNTVKIQ